VVRVTEFRLLEPFGGAGGSGEGYRRAQFDVTCVDIADQPHCPHRFIQADAFEYIAEHGHEFDAIHVGPPCQGYSTTRALHGNYYPRWIAPLRILLDHIGVPYVIENVEGARAHMRNPVRLCGSSFGLGVRRHRLFETSWPIAMAPQCAHHLQPAPIDVTGTGASRIGPRLDGGGGNSRKPRNLAHAREVMGIDWMTRTELAESVPPAYTEWLGEQLLEHLQSVAA
jgi:DNA (cytosine-5)-methyltransferase 1